MKRKMRQGFRKLLKPTFSIWTVLFLLLQIMAGVLAPVSDFWRPSLQKAEAATPSWGTDYGSWAYRKPIPVAGSASWGSAQTNYQVPVNPSVEEVFDKTGLVGDWNFDEGGGTVASDKSGSGNHGTLNSSSAWTSSGKFNNAFSGNGSSYYTSLSSPVSGIQSSDYSVGAWIRQSAGTGADIDEIFNQDYDGNHQIRLELTPTNCYAQFNTYEGGYGTVTGTTNVCDGQWHYIVAKKSGTTGYIYVDGNLQNSGTVKNVASTDRATVGALRYSGGTIYYFNGSIDETKIWNRALTADEIYKHYVGYANNSLVGSWHFSEGSGTTAADSSGQGNNGTITGATWAADKYGTANKALSFNGSSNYVNIGNVLNPGTNSISSEFWLYVPSLPFSGYQGVLTKGGFGTSWIPGLNVMTNSGTSQLYMSFQFDTPNYVSTPTVTTGWNYISIVRNTTTKTQEIYVNGAKVDSYTFTTVGNATNADYLFLAAQDNGSAHGIQRYYNGSIDEVKIYNRALTASEIAERYRNSSKMRDDYGDLRFTNATGTALDYWQENDSKVWVEADSIPNTAAGTTLYQYYGNPTAASASNGENTFIQYHGNATAEFHDSNIATGPGIASRHSVTIDTSTPQNVVFGVGDNLFSGTTNNLLSMQHYSAGSAKYAYSKASGSSSSYSVAGLPTTGVPHIWETKYLSGSAKYLIDGVEYGSGITTNLPTAALGLAYWVAEGTGSTHNWGLVRKYVSPEPTVGTTGAEQAEILDYTYKKNITFKTDSPISVATSQNNFPVAVHINASSWPTQAERDSFFDTNTNGKRILFFDSDETTSLPYEVEYFSNVQGSEEAIYWVKVPQVDGNSATDKIVVAYGNDPYSADQDNPKKVWDGNFKGAWHLPNGATLSASDSTVNVNNGTISGATATSGRVDGGGNFNGSAYINAGNGSSLNITGDITITHWINFNSIVAYAHYLSFYNTASPNQGYAMTMNNSTSKIRFYTNNTGWVDSNSTVSTGNWYFLAVTGSGSSGTFYRGLTSLSSDGTFTYSPPSSGSFDRWIGAYQAPNNYLNGIMDEIRISSSARSADWIKLEYYSMKKTNYNGDNDGTNKFITFGSQTSTNPNSTPDAPTGLAQYKSDCTTSISTGGWTNETSVCLKGYINDADTNDQVKMAAEVTTGSFTGTPTHTAAAYVTDPNTSSVSVTSLVNGSQYRWQGRSLDDDAATSSFTQFNSGNLSFGIDTSAPTGGSITYTDGYYTTASVALTAADGTDGASGVNTSSRIVQRKSATLTDGTCGSYGSFATITPTGTYPNFTDSTVVSGNCYQYQYLVSDNVTNQATYTSSNTAKIDTTTPDIVAADAGASSGDRTSLTSNTWFAYAATGSDDQVSFSWTDPSSVSDDTFYYELNASSGNTVTGDESTVTTPYVDSITITEGTSYFHVRPRNGAATWGTERVFTVKYDKSGPTGASISNITADSTTQLTASGNTATDSYSGLHATPYYFENTTASTNSSWQAGTSWISATLSPNTQYTFREKSKDTLENESGYSSTSSKYTLASQVSGLSAADATTKSNYRINLTWTNQGQSGIKIEQDTGCDGYETTAYDNASSTPATPYAVNVSANTCYQFRISSYNGDGTINSVSIPETSQITTPPAQPTGLAHTGNTTSSIDWDWNDVSGATGYKVYRSSDNQLLTTIATATSNWTQDSLSSDTQYSVYVRATNANGEGIASLSASAYTSADTPINTNHLTNDTDSITWTWDSGGSEKDFYAWCEAPADNSGWIGTTSWLQGSLSANELYEFFVKARNEENDETGSASTSKYTSQNEPTGISFDDVAADSITLSADGTFPNLGDDSSGLYFENVTATQNSGWLDTNEWINSSLSPNTEYSYKVRARNGDSDNTSYTAEEQKYTLANAPGTPTVNTPTINTMKVTVNQNSNPANTEFAIYETSTDKYVDSTDGSLDQSSEDWQTYATFGGASGITVTGLSENTTYTFKVKARNHDDIETALSSSASGTTGNSPDAPTLVSPADGTYTTDTTPDFSAHYQDADIGDTGTTNYRIASTSASDCLNNLNIVANGASIETITNDEDTQWTSDILTDGEYFWCAQNSDGTNTSSWTTMGSFILDTATPDISAVDAGASDIDRTSLTSDTWFDYAATGSDDQISFSWTDPSSISGDIFYYELNSDSGETINGTKSNTANNYLDDISISEGTSYLHAKPRNGALTWGTERIFTVKYDKSAPAGGSPGYTDGYYSTASVNLTADDGTDAGSDIDVSSRIFERKEADLAAGICGAYGAYANITPAGTYPDFSDTTVTNAKCYQYQYSVSDNLGHQAIYTGTNEAKVDTEAPVGTTLALGTITTTSITASASGAADTLSGLHATPYYFKNTTAGTNSGWQAGAAWESASLSPNTAYTFRVKSRDAAGNESDWSGEATETTEAEAATSDDDDDDSHHHHSSSHSDANNTIQTAVSNLPKYISNLPDYLNSKFGSPGAPEESIIPKEAPPALKGEWNLLPVNTFGELSFNSLPDEIQILAQKFPTLQNTFASLGIANIFDLGKLQGANLSLPNISQILALGQTNLPAPDFLEAGLPKYAELPLSEMPAEAREKIPTEIVFAKTAGEQIDLNINLTLDQQGKPEQKINLLSGKNVQLIVKPEGEVNNIKGYLVFKSHDTQGISYNPQGEPQVAGVSSAIISLKDAIGSAVFPAPTLAQTYNPESIETRLVLAEFEYADPDNDGIYTADVQAPQSEGEYEVITVMDYKDVKIGKKEIRLITVVDPEGYVYEKIKNGEFRIINAIVSLYYLTNNNQYELWPAGSFQQENPQTTDATGKYSFLVPPGKYYLKADAPGYKSYQSDEITVQTGGGIHKNIEMKSSSWLKNFADWKTILLVVVILLLGYNFYRDRKSRITRNA